MDEIAAAAGLARREVTAALESVDTSKSKTASINKKITIPK